MLMNLPIPVLRNLLEMLDCESLTAITEVVPLAAELVNNARHLYPGNPVYKLECTSIDEVIFLKVWSKRCCGRFSCKSTKTVTVCKHEFEQFMYTMTPKYFEFEDMEICDKLKQTWWNRINNITIKSELPDVTRWSRKMGKCSRLTIEYSRQITAKEWLDSMRAVESFCFYNITGPGIQIDDECLKLLIEKSQNGQGLMKLTAQCDPNTKVSPQKLAKFFAEAKFGRPQVSLGTLEIAGTKKMLDKQLQGRKIEFIGLSHPFFVVERHDCMILAKLHFSGLC